MKNNKYTQAIGKIKAPEDVLERAIENVKNYDTCDNVIILDKRRPTMKKRTKRALAATAAALVFAIILGVQCLPFGSGGNPFTLTANAESLNTEAYVTIGKLDTVGSEAGWGFDDPDFDKDESYFNKIREVGIVKDVEMKRVVNMDIKCSADDAKSITYTTQNGYFLVDTSFDGIIDYTTLTESDSYRTILSVNNMTPVSSVTFDYSKQPKSRLTTEMSDPDGIDGTFPVCAVFAVQKDEVDLRNYLRSYGETDGTADGDVDCDALFTDIFNGSETIYSTDITVTYNDGSAKTETLNYKCEYENDHTVMTAKIAE